MAPEVDLNSPFFGGSEYEIFKNRIRENQDKYPDIKVVDRYVYIRIDHYDGFEENEQNSWKLWIPEELRKDLIIQMHNYPTASHGGMVKTLDLLKRLLFWPGMSRDVREYIRNCDICKSTKAPNFVMKPEMGQQTISIKPFQRMFIDLLGSYPRSKSGNIGLLIVLDHFSKFHWLHPLNKFTSNNIREFLQQHIFHVYGVPETVVSDNGSQFRANDI